MITRIFLALAIAFGMIAAPTLNVETSVVTEVEVMSWDEFHAEELSEALAHFDHLFNSYEYKLSKNNRSMIRRDGETSFKFVAKGK